MWVFFATPRLDRSPPPFSKTPEDDGLGLEDDDHVNDQSTPWAGGFLPIQKIRHVASQLGHPRKLGQAKDAPTAFSPTTWPNYPKGIWLWFKTRAPC